jgi:hypothetical protein
VLAIELLFPPLDRRRLMYPLVWMLASVPVAWITSAVQPDTLVHTKTPLWTRPFVAGDAVSYYAFKLMAPVNLAVTYGRTPDAVMASALPYVLWIVPAGMIAIAWVLRRRLPTISLALAIILLFLAPVSGLVPFAFQNYSTVADRYFYMPMVGVSLIVAWTVAQVPSGAWAGTLSAVLIAGLLFLNVRQQPVWSSELELWQHTLDIFPHNAKAQFGFGAALAAAGDDRGAIDHYQQSIAISPSDADVFFDLGNADYRLGRTAAAMDAYRQAARLDPGHVGARANLLMRLLETGQLDEARQVAAELRRLAPEHPVLESIRRQGGL